MVEKKSAISYESIMKDLKARKYSPVTQKVFDQISVYNLLLHVDFLVVSNGLEHYICKMDYESKKYVFLETIPDYSDLLTL